MGKVRYVEFEVEEYHTACVVMEEKTVAIVKDREIKQVAVIEVDTENDSVQIRISGSEEFKDVVTERVAPVVVKIAFGGIVWTWN